MKNKQSTTFFVRRSAIWDGTMAKFGDERVHEIKVPGTGDEAVRRAKKVLCEDLWTKAYQKTKGRVKKNRPMPQSVSVPLEQRPLYRGMGVRWMLVSAEDHTKILDNNFA